MSACDRAAEVLARARMGGPPIGHLPAELRPRDETRAYEIQQALHAHLTGEGLGPIVGHKIGCTTPVMQRYLGIAQPCAGGVFQSTVLGPAGSIRAADFQRVGVECEIAVRLRKDISGALASRSDLADCVAYAVAAMEIVDDRYRNFSALGVMTLIADDFFNAGCVLGEPGEDSREIDLAAVTGAMWINDVEAGRGQGTDILGHPLNALAWLAERYSHLDRPLRAGEFVLLGSLVQTQWLTAGDDVRIEVSGLGSASLSVL